ncbi:UNVERIFIED_CONTAM: hypothetical protein FKN15_023255 [Acipenser sinensis]
MQSVTGHCTADHLYDLLGVVGWLAGRGGSWAQVLESPLALVDQLQTGGEQHVAGLAAGEEGVLVGHAQALQLQALEVPVHRAGGQGGGEVGLLLALGSALQTGLTLALGDAGLGLEAVQGAATGRGAVRQVVLTQGVRLSGV